LSGFQKKLCNVLQEGLPICARPFAEIAKVLDSDEAEVLKQTAELKNLGVIRRISALVNHRALGMKSTLVAVHVPQEVFREVAEAVNSLQGVSHNYQRDHHYNLWFTLQRPTSAEIDVTLSRLSARFGVAFHGLPVKRLFKLAVRFDAESGGQQLLQGPQKTLSQEPVELNREQKQILTRLQKDLQLSKSPFDFLCGPGSSREQVLAVISELLETGVIRCIRAIVDYRKLGFMANVLFVAAVPQNEVVEAGRRLARFGVVSHCYERRTFKGWPYNLFAMMHGRNMAEIRRVIEKFVAAQKVDSFQLLPTVGELKKQPVTYAFDE
jgi:DNA-binding Lrp family transcriptional regulator